MDFHEVRARQKDKFKEKREPITFYILNTVNYQLNQTIAVFKF